jgi:hypothetical protein
MKLLITTQVYENYAWLEDGTLGVGDAAYWKAKGGNDYVIRNFKGGDAAATAMVMSVRGQIEMDNDGFREHIAYWAIVADDYFTESERDQLEYEGRIVYPATELTVV